MIARVFFGVLALVILSAAGFAYWVQSQLRGSLPLLDGSLQVAGLTAEVLISRDSHGRPTIEAENEIDMARALGFVHAQDRFFQMDLLRRVSAGELAALFGAGLIEHDRGKALFRLRSHSQTILANLPSHQRDRLEAYAHGVNAGLQSLGARPFPYLLLRQQPEPWLPEDSLLAGFTKYFTLQDANGFGEHTRRVMMDSMPVSLQDLLLHSQFRLESPLLGQDTEQSRPPQLPSASDWQQFQQSISELTPVAGFYEREPFPIGSNSWAVDGRFTPHGYPIVSNDMHLEQALPTVWYRARLIFNRSGTQVDLAGVTLPGIPGMIVGSSEHIVWGFTNSNISTTDLLEWEPTMEVFSTEVVIRVAGGESVRVPVEYTHLGPVTSFPGDSRRYVLQWTALLQCGINLDLVDFELATSVEQVFEIAHGAGLPTQNLIVADRSGSIGWTLIGAIPQRESTGVWTGRVPSRTYPTVVNPDSGVLWTANNRIAVGEWRTVLGEAGPAEDGRAYAIAEALAQRESFDEKDLLAIQLLNRTPVLDAWHKLLLDELQNSEEASFLALRERVSGWSGGANPDDRAHEVIMRFRADLIHAFTTRVFAPLQSRYPTLRAWSTNLETAVYTVMSGRQGTWAAEEFDEAVAASLQRLAEFPERPWREYNQLHLQHPMTFAVPQLGRWLNAQPVGMAGDSRAPNAQLRNHGASQRLNAAPGQWASAILHMPGGQSEHPLSPFYLSEQRAFILAQPTPLVPRAAQYKLLLQPY